ncbi:MAG: tyrosine-type recombinase/integrase [Bacteroidales bacterium]|nr:tyrosine-type recombinase/integrase [Bacteroidales bacterium]
MPKTENTPLQSQDIIQSSLSFTMPRITYGRKDIVLSFYAYDSQSCRMRRKRIKLNHLGQRWFIRRREREICGKFLALLAKGWSPFDAGGGAILTRLRPDVKVVPEKVSLKVALHRYDEYVRSEVERKVMSEASVKTYSSYISKLLSFLPPSLTVSDISTPTLVAFVDHMKEQNLSPKTCNSTIGWLKTVFGWMLERGLVADNPASAIKTETLDRRQGRPTLTDPERETLFLRLRKEGCLEFLLACLMEYYTYIRPNELYRVKVRFISLEEQTVTVPADISKNRKTAKVTLPSVVVSLMRELRIDRHPGDDYLFGKGLKCGPKIGNAKQFGRWWDNHVVCDGGIYPELKGRKVVFYSLKNSGITDMLERGVPSAVVRDQARHQDLSTTEIYGRSSGMKAPESLKDYR